MCIVCGEPLKTGKYTCSVVCRHKITGMPKQDRIDSWLAGGQIDARTAKSYLAALRGERCEKCGWAERHPVTGNIPIELDHIDGDWRNDAFENLRLLCPNCHSLTPTYRALNIGSRARPWRRA